MANPSSEGCSTTLNHFIYSTPTVLLPKLSICIFARSESLAQSLRQFLSSDRYNLTHLSSTVEFFDFLEQHKHHLDCLVLHNDRTLLPAVNQLYETATLLPVVIVQSESEQPGDSESKLVKVFADETHSKKATNLYHVAEVLLPFTQLSKIAHFIDQAIAQFLDLAPNYRLPDQSATADPTAELTNQNFLMRQQRRLAEKLKERLGYLAVYYKRNPQHFFRNLSRSDKQELLEKLKLEYRQIVLDYFSQDDTLNQQIDNFANLTFFADLSVSQIVEIHMELMEEFSHQLKVEGRSEEILLDYRLTLIDIIAHLCEMYRRAIPREV